MGQEGRARVARLSLSLCAFVPPLSPPRTHANVCVGCASCLWLSSGSCCVQMGCYNDCSETIRSIKARSAVLCMLHDVAPWVEIRSEFERVRGVNSLGQRGMFSDKKQCASGQQSSNGRAEKPRCDVPEGVGFKNRYEAELTNWRRGSRSTI